MRRFAVVGLVAVGLVSCGVSLSSATARAEVVFGNLGASGTNALSNTNSDITSTYKVAVPFTTGASSAFLKLQSITVGLFYDTFATSSFGLSIYENNAGVPSATIAATAPAQIIGGIARYTYNFSNFQMAANTTYWIRPDTDLSWYTPNTALTPAAYNSSGYSWPGAGLTSTDGGSTWGPDEFVLNGRYAFSVQAVPEPSTYALAAAGLGIAGLVRARRRKAAV